AWPGACPSSSTLKGSPGDRCRMTKTTRLTPRSSSAVSASSRTTITPTRRNAARFVVTFAPRPGRTIHPRTRSTCRDESRPGAAPCDSRRSSSASSGMCTAAARRGARRAHADGLEVMLEREHHPLDRLALLLDRHLERERQGLAALLHDAVGTRGEAGLVQERDCLRGVVRQRLHVEVVGPAAGGEGAR